MKLNENEQLMKQLNGTSKEERNLAKFVQNLNSGIKTEHLKWDQEKINQVWEASEIIYKKYGIQLDPRLMLSIIFKEGTGSFNTSHTNLAADGQYGVENNFALDLVKASDLLIGKILATYIMVMISTKLLQIIIIIKLELGVRAIFFNLLIGRRQLLG